MDNLTLIEQECEDILLRVRDLLGVVIFAKSRRREFIDLMGDIREAIDHLNNKKFGCASGYHAGDCLCQKDERGKSIETIKHGGKQ